MDLLDSDEMKAKMGRLNPDLQGLFLRYMRQMYDQESDMMINFIAESRQDLLDDTAEFSSEPEQLHDEKRLSTGHGKTSTTNSRNSSIVPIDEVDNKLAVERYMARRQRETTNHGTQSRSASFVHSPAPSGPDSVSLPGTPDSGASAHSLYQEETQEIIRDMTQATAKIENERDRQRELVQQMKEKKRAQQLAQAQMAHSIIEKAGESELAIQKEKLRQEQMLKEKLEKKRREGAMSVSREATQLNVGQNSEAAQATVGDPASDSEHKEKKKKKKKKKDKDQEKDEEESERKKKKKKKRDKKKEHGENDESDEKKEKRKKKKKHKDKDKDLEDGAIEDQIE